MTIQEVYEEYRHIDPLLTDDEWLPDTLMGAVLKECWLAIKQEVEK